MAVKLLDGAINVGSSGSWAVRMKTRNHTVQVTIMGVPSAVTVDLDGSLDNKTWLSLASYVLTAEDLTAATAMCHVVDKSVRYVRISLTSLVSGGGASVTALYEGETA